MTVHLARELSWKISTRCRGPQQNPLVSLCHLSWLWLNQRSGRSSAPPSSWTCKEVLKWNRRLQDQSDVWSPLNASDFALLSLLWCLLLLCLSQVLLPHLSSDWSSVGQNMGKFHESQFLTALKFQVSTSCMPQLFHLPLLSTPSRNGQGLIRLRVRSVINKVKWVIFFR